MDVKQSIKSIPNFIRRWQKKTIEERLLKKIQTSFETIIAWTQKIKLKPLFLF